MKVAKLFHNPKVGDEGHGKDELVSQIKAAGFDCRYSSTKGWNWNELEEDIDFVVVAGGDGTVRKITKSCLIKKCWIKHTQLRCCRWALQITLVRLWR